MDKAKQTALEAAGYRVGDAADFLGLTDDEAKLVELRVQVSRAIRHRRESQHLSQRELAAKLKTSQPRVAKIESAAADVSLDQMFRGLYALGGSLDDVHIVQQQAPPLTPSRRRAGASRAEPVLVDSTKVKVAKRKKGDESVPI